MKREDFIAQLSEIKQQQATFHEKEVKLRDKYIDKHTKDIPIGSRVSVELQTKEGALTKEGFVYNWIVLDNGTIVPKLHKIRKDGSEAFTNIFIYTDNIMSSKIKIIK